MGKSHPPPPKAPPKPPLKNMLKSSSGSTSPCAVNGPRPPWCRRVSPGVSEPYRSYAARLSASLRHENARDTAARMPELIRQSHRDEKARDTAAGMRQATQAAAAPVSAFVGDACDRACV